MRTPEARRRLEPARELLDDEPFWETVRDGLAIYLSPSIFRAYSVSSPLREFLEVGDRFHLKPLLPVLRGDGRFFLLGLSQQRIALLEGTRESLVEVSVPKLPKDIADALHVESWPPERQLNFRSQAPRGGRRQSLWHGHAQEAQDITRPLLDYFHVVDRAVSTYLRSERVPLVLSAVDYLQPLYAQVNTYPHLLKDGVAGNPEVFNIEDLHQRAWSIVQSALDREQESAIAEFGDFAGGPRSSQETSTIVVGAYFARVGRLFIAQDTELWGRFDPQTLEVSVHEQRVPGDVDLLDWAAVRTLSTDGIVHAVPRARVPGGGPMAALFRF
jgi:hypothetical protein